MTPGSVLVFGALLSAAPAFAATGEEIKEFAAKPKVAAYVISAKLCDALNDRAEALKGIAEERKYARQAGVTNLARLESFKGDVRTADYDIAGAKKALRDLKAKPTRCNDAGIVDLLICVGDQMAEGCRAEKLQTWRAIYLYVNDGLEPPP